MTFVAHSEDGQRADLGIASMRQIASSGDTGGAFALVEFSGGPGPWTVPHIHQQMDESFYVTEGMFTFTCGGDTIETHPGSYVLVPRGVPHSFEAGPEGGSLLTLFVPGGLEAMFIELATLPPGALTDPAIRAEISARFDSKPV